MDVDKHRARRLTVVAAVVPVVASTVALVVVFAVARWQWQLGALLPRLLWVSVTLFLAWVLVSRLRRWTRWFAGVIFVSHALISLAALAATSQILLGLSRAIGGAAAPVQPGVTVLLVALVLCALLEAFAGILLLADRGIRGYFAMSGSETPAESA